MLDRTVDRQRGWVKLPCGGWWVDIFTSAMLCTSTMGDGQLGGLAKCNAFLNCLFSLDVFIYQLRTFYRGCYFCLVGVRVGKLWHHKVLEGTFAIVLCSTFPPSRWDQINTILIINIRFTNNNKISHSIFIIGNL